MKVEGEGVCIRNEGEGNPLFIWEDLAPKWNKMAIKAQNPPKNIIL